MDESRLTKKVFRWDKNLNDSHNINTWSSEVNDILIRNNIGHIYHQNIFSLSCALNNLRVSLLDKDRINWQSQCRNLPKLRTFIQFKDFTCDSPHTYKPLSFFQRKLMSKFRLGMLHLRIETGRFIRLLPEERLCLVCNGGEVEDKTHFLLRCNKYNLNRQKLSCRSNFP